MILIIASIEAQGKRKLNNIDIARRFVHAAPTVGWGLFLSVAGWRVVHTLGNIRMSF